MAAIAKKPGARSQRPESRDKTADFVADWMHANCPSWSIDELLTHPYEAIRMAREVLRKLRRELNGDNEDSEIHRICKAALNARKRGDLKRDPH